MKNRTNNHESTASSTQINCSNINDLKQTLIISTERQYRLILAILERPIGTNELIRLIGANNVPAVVMRLRRKGWLIHTLMAPIYNRDGEKVDAGSYKIDQSQIEGAREALSAWRLKHPLNEV